jgi:polyhydroxyalkanoate synthesis regulator phasin
MTEFDPRLLDPRLKAKGRRPYFFDDPAIDKLLSITMAVAGELAVTRERLDTVERLLAQKGLLSADEIDAYRPDETSKEERAAWRSDYVARVLRILQNEYEALDRTRAEADYDAVVRDLAQE